MSDTQAVIAHAAWLTLVAILAGLVWRGRARYCWTFTVYLAVALVCNTLITAWPERFFTASFYTLKEAAYNVLVLTAGAELAWRTFRAFPEALRRAQLVLGLILSAAFLAVTPLPWGLTYGELILDYNPRLQAGSMWLFTATAILIAWYRLPVHQIQRAIALGMGCYLFVFTTAWNAVRDFGLADINAWRGYVDLAAGIAFVLIGAWWARAAWRRDEPLEIPAHLLRLLGWQPA